MLTFDAVAGLLGSGFAQLDGKVGNSGETAYFLPRRPEGLSGHNGGFEAELRPQWVNLRVMLPHLAVSRAFRFYGGEVSVQSVRRELTYFLQRKADEGSVDAASLLLALTPQPDTAKDALLAASTEVDVAVRRALSDALGEDWMTGRSVEEGVLRLRQRVDAMETHARLLEQLLVFRSEATPMPLKEGDPMPPPVAMLCRIVQGIFAAHPEAKNYVSFGWTDNSTGGDGQSYTLEAQRAEGESSAMAAKRLKADLDDALACLRTLATAAETYMSVDAEMPTFDVDYNAIDAAVTRAKGLLAKAQP